MIEMSDDCYADATRFRHLQRGLPLKVVVPAPTERNPNAKVTVIYGPHTEADWGKALAQAIDAAMGIQSRGRDGVETRGALTGPAVAWEYRTWRDGNGDEPVGWGAWERLQPKGLQTIDDAVRDMRDYILRGYRYELRWLVAHPDGDPQRPVLTMDAMPATGSDDRCEAARSARPHWAQSNGQSLLQVPVAPCAAAGPYPTAMRPATAEEAARFARALPADVLLLLQEAAQALEGAAQWLGGWASAEPYLSQVQSVAALLRQRLEGEPK